MKKKIISLLLAVSLVSAMVTGCATASTKTAETSASGGETIKIGYIGALSGDTALWGQAGLNGMLLKAKEVNANGGVLGKQIEVIGLDGKGEAADSLSAYKKLVDEYGVSAVVGTNFSSCNIPIAEASDDLKVPVVATAASNELVTVDASGNLHPYSFRLCYIDSFQGEILGRIATEKYDFKTAAVIVDASDSYSTSLSDFFIKSFEENGGKIVSEEKAQGGDSDFRAQLTKIAATKPDVVFIPWIYQNVALIAKQARELGIDAPLLGADGWDSAELAGLAEGALENSFYVSRIGFNSAEAAAYGEKYKAEYSIDLEAECLFGNDGLEWILDAIERAGSADSAAIRDQLENTPSFTGLLGEMSVDPATHNPTRDIAIYSYKDDAFVYDGIFK